MSPVAVPVKIAGLGRYLPARVVSNEEIEARCGLPAGWVASRTGVRERRWVDGETNAFMAAAAAREALEDAGLPLEAVDLILNASGTQEQAIPDGAPLVQRALGLGASGVPCFSVHATCLSFLVALDVAAGLLVSGRHRTILVVSAEIGSPGLNFAEPESAALIGDAAAAAVLTCTPEGEPSAFHRYLLRTYGEGAHLTEVRGAGSRRSPNHPDTRPEDNLFHMEGPNVLRLTRRYAPAFLEALSPGLSRGLGEVALVVPHQASGVGLRVLQGFGWPEDRIAVTLDRLGNCVSASLPATLYEVVRAGRLRRGEQVLLLGTGAGLSIGGLVLTY